MILHIRHLYKSYKNPVFEDFSMSFKENEITCILGPSGCGKTTLLHIIGGLIRPEGGILEGFNDKQLSYVFQDSTSVTVENGEKTSNLSCPDICMQLRGNNKPNN